MYVVLTGDLRASRKLRDRDAVQRRLLQTLDDVNRTYAGAIIAPFALVGGDGFQGMLSTVEPLTDLYFTVVYGLGAPFALGVGIGGVSTAVTRTVHEIDGPAFHRARAALEQAQRSGLVAVEGLALDDTARVLWQYVAALMVQWTPRQREVIAAVQAQGVAETARHLAVTERSIYKVLHAARYQLYRNGVTTLQANMNQKWFDNYNEP